MGTALCHSGDDDQAGGEITGKKHTRILSMEGGTVCFRPLTTDYLQDRLQVENSLLSFQSTFLVLMTVKISLKLRGQTLTKRALVE